MSTDTRNQCGSFRELLHNVRAYIQRVHAPADPHPRYQQLAAWQALPPLESAGYDHDRIWQHLRNLERLSGLARTRKADRKRSAAFWDALLPALERRARTHSHVYVIVGEAQQLNRYGLRQPGHTVHRYSTPGEDLSDVAQGIEAQA